MVLSHCSCGCKKNIVVFPFLPDNYLGVHAAIPARRTQILGPIRQGENCEFSHEVPSISMGRGGTIYANAPMRVKAGVFQQPPKLRQAKGRKALLPSKKFPGFLPVILLSPFLGTFLWRGQSARTRLERGAFGCIQSRAPTRCRSNLAAGLHRT